jgi:hypothetical protein
VDKPTDNPKINGLPIGLIHKKYKFTPQNLTGANNIDHFMCETILSSNDSLKREDQLLYLSGVPYTGYLEERYPSGQIKGVQQYLNGQKHGICKTYYEGGKLKTASLFREGKLNGEHTVWWENGRRKSTLNYVDGQLYGKCEEWFSNGNLKSRWHFIGGERCILFRQWDEDGVANPHDPQPSKDQLVDANVHRVFQ